jgi:hypothetical protein
MKSAKTVVGLGLGLLVLVAADAVAQQCRARVEKKSFAASQTFERGWDIVFDVNVDGCAAAQGTFEYVVQLDVEGERKQATVEGSFLTETAGVNTITIEYRGPAGSNLKDVGSVKMKTCQCS